MKKLIMFCFILLSCLSWATPESSMSFKKNYMFVVLYYPSNLSNTITTTVFKDESLTIPMILQYSYLRGLKEWYFPANVRLANIGGYCPGINNGDQDYIKRENAICNMNIYISSKGAAVGDLISGQLRYKLHVKEDFGQNVNVYLYYNVKVIPHPLTMNVMQQQDATLGKNFIYDFKTSAIRYYDENLKAGAAVVGYLLPEESKRLEELGLKFDEKNITITGIPKKSGVYTVHVGAKITSSTTSAAAQPFTIRIGVNAKDTPVFKEQSPIVAAIANKEYHLNLLNLLEPKQGFAETNQISFKVVKNDHNARWLDVSPTDATLLKGMVDPKDAGKVVEVSLIATSNTGGDSKVKVIKIPVSADETQRPTIKPFELKSAAGNPLSVDLSTYIIDPAHDSSLKAVIDKIEQVTLDGVKTVSLSWLRISAVTPTVLEGEIPLESPGEQYLITWRATTQTGGSSAAITVPLHIEIDAWRTPHFKAGTPQLPLVYPGQAFVHNFMEQRAVLPEYDDAPYEIQFAKDYVPPTWLTLENNQLFAKEVPADIEEPVIDVDIIIKNIPGGSSNVITLHLTVMN